jgi:hypothetical protein
MNDAILHFSFNKSCKMLPFFFLPYMLILSFVAYSSVIVSIFYLGVMFFYGMKIITHPKDDTCKRVAFSVACYDFVAQKRCMQHIC